MTDKILIDKDKRDWVKVQYTDFNIYWHNLNVPDKMIMGEPALYVKRNINDEGHLWLQRRFVKFTDIENKFK